MKEVGSWWLVVGSWLVVGAALASVYTCGYLRGEIAGMTESEVAR